MVDRVDDRRASNAAVAAAIELLRDLGGDGGEQLGDGLAGHGDQDACGSG